MGLSASQGRLLLLTARRSDLEYRAQQISQKRLVLSQQLEEISLDYENATSNRQMKIALFLNGENDGTDAVNRTSNLTYAALVSGTVGASGPGTAISGIQGYSRTEDQMYSSTTAYRLVSVDGAIVVSDAREIPTTQSTSKSTTSAASKYGENIENLYTSKVTTYSSDGNTSIKENGLYAVAKEDTDLYDALDGLDSVAVEIDPKTGIVKVTDEKNNTTYYNLNTGAKATEEEEGQDFTGESATLVSSLSKVPKNEVITETSEGLNLVEGADGVYTLKDSNGAVIQRYIVDQSLKYGSTDVDGTTDGPNYLQDCLRNGKYLLEKGSVDQNVDEGYRWSSVSWDATANISDSYYTEDDDTAKAKYDRLQAQIQSQDKKLELELDNIETQRNAVTTEVESVEKVISDDIEGTFNAFG